MLKKADIRLTKLMKKTIIRDDGLTEQEGKAMDALVKAWNIFIKLECQHILMCRVLRRDYPKGYPIYSG